MAAETVVVLAVHRYCAVVVAADGQATCNPSRVIGWALEAAEVNTDDGDDDGDKDGSSS